LSISEIARRARYSRGTVMSICALKFRQRLRRDQRRDSRYDLLIQRKITTYNLHIKPLVVPKSIDLYIVFDSWWFSSDLFSKCLKLGHNIVCQIESDKRVGINKDMYFQVRDLANQIEDKYFIKTTVSVRGKKKTYFAFEKKVIVDKVGEVKLVISKRKKDSTTKYIISTNGSLSCVVPNVWTLYTPF
jgi:hypothetical protein